MDKKDMQKTKFTCITLWNRTFPFRYLKLPNSALFRTQDKPVWILFGISFFHKKKHLYFQTTLLYHCVFHIRVFYYYCKTYIFTRKLELCFDANTQSNNNHIILGTSVCTSLNVDIISLNVNHFLNVHSTISTSNVSL